MTEITSLIKFLQWVDTENEINGFTQYPVFYRGQADLTWGFVPSVFRSDKGKYYNEFNLISEARVKCWKWLQDCKTELEQLIKFQHYGLKTRLLDLTTNPLVVLYFACCDLQDNDGVVYCTYNNRSDILVAKLIAKIIFCHDKSECKIPENKLLSYARDVGLIITNTEELYSELSKAHLIISPFNNDRIANQNGAFVIAPLLDSENQIIIQSRELDLSKEKYNLVSTKKSNNKR